MSYIVLRVPKDAPRPLPPGNYTLTVAERFDTHYEATQWVAAQEDEKDYLIVREIYGV
jgi:hypothetical protein